MFVVQVDGQEEEKVVTKSGRKEKTRKKKHQDLDKYAGYEILLTAEDDPGYKPPKGEWKI